MKNTFYSEQALNNTVCLVEDAEYEERREVFVSIVKKAQENKVRWALGCSMNLYLRGITDDFNDIDIIVDADSVDAMLKIIEEMDGKLIATGGNGFCESDLYFHYQVGGVDIDIISGFRILTFGTSFCYKYCDKEIDEVFIQGIETTVPLISMEALYILYYMMEGWQPKRKFKRQLIEQYIETMKLTYPEILKNALKEHRLPAQIRWSIRALLKQK